MLNVAVSRAKDSFLAFGNMEIFKQEDARHRPSGVPADHLFANEKNKLPDDDLIRLIQGRQKNMQSSSSIKLFVSLAPVGSTESLRAYVEKLFTIGAEEAMARNVHFVAMSHLHPNWNTDPEKD
ncbi:MAG TPA: hypothetical protein VIC84_25530 [Blastocatellia bacterium]